MAKVEGHARMEGEVKVIRARRARIERPELDESSNEGAAGPREQPV